MSQELVQQEFSTELEEQVANLSLDQRSELLFKIIPDLEQAINLIRDYQRMLDMLGSNDPNLVEAHKLMNKYGMAQERVQLYRILVDGIDITEHPDSIEGSTSGVIELESEELPEIEETTSA